MKSREQIESYRKNKIGFSEITYLILGLKSNSFPLSSGKYS
ncbi:MAG: hypothetical protein BAJALOKI3v1_370025 [Promethearchaeota archaeon]|nr:MAG: hypothetical protein BAJALOKI3v1_370025 [Candidatus Lokiarchaeota archaeon]